MGSNEMYLIHISFILDCIYNSNYSIAKCCVFKNAFLTQNEVDVNLNFEQCIIDKLFLIKINHYYFYFKFMFLIEVGGSD